VFDSRTREAQATDLGYVVTGGEARSGGGLGRQEGNVIEDMPPERADLVDVFYSPFVRPLGNLVVLFAQAEAAWLALVAELTGCTEKEAQRFLEMKASDVKQEIIPLAQASGVEG
jgi:hypothetical protein